MLCFVLFLAPASYVQSKDYDAGSKSFLWKVKSTTATAYILGSIHVMKPESYPLNTKIETAFGESGVLAVEADIDNISEKDIAALITKAVYSGDDSLDKHISKATFELVMKESRDLGIDPGLLLKQKPLFLASSIEIFTLTRMGFDPNCGVDEHFLMEAAGKKKIMELESIDSQLALIEGFSDSEQDALLYTTIKNIDKLQKIAGELVEAWNAGDSKKIDSLMFQDTENDPKMVLINDKLITERNAAMVVKIDDMLKTRDSYFIVIGAGHLVGDRGVIELLRKKGYTVEQQ
ncbi:MAG TPA: TraB/GumN family protein [Dissulfurispiraceae bacterium]|nr:TraB/GumN family protein [Dissulfurispiraceae bacterium]